jgi:hypothetical protein
MNWDIGLSKPIAGWADYNAKELRGVGEKSIVNFFRRGGFDKFGFNVKGYDRFSTHYSDVLKLADSEGDDARQIQRRLVDATRRMMLAGILENIPRYADLLEQMKEEDGSGVSAKSEVDNTSTNG